MELTALSLLIFGLGMLLGILVGVRAPKLWLAVPLNLNRIVSYGSASAPHFLTTSWLSMAPTVRFVLTRRNWT